MPWRRLTATLVRYVEAKRLAVMELEDGYGIRISEDEAERIKTIGQAVDFVISHAPAHPTP